MKLEAISHQLQRLADHSGSISCCTGGLFINQNGLLNPGPTEHQLLNPGPTDHRLLNPGPTEHQLLNPGPTDHRLLNPGPTEHQLLNPGPTDHRLLNPGPTEHRLLNPGPTEHRLLNPGPTDHRLLNPGTTDHRLLNPGPTDHQLCNPGPTDHQLCNPGTTLEPPTHVPRGSHNATSGSRSREAPDNSIRLQSVRSFSLHTRRLSATSRRTHSLRNALFWDARLTAELKVKVPQPGASSSTRHSQHRRPSQPSKMTSFCACLPLVASERALAVGLVFTGLIRQGPRQQWSPFCLKGHNSLLITRQSITSTFKLL